MKAAEADLLSEAGVFNLAAPQILPLIKERKEAALSQLLGKFRSGEANLLADVASLNALVALEEDIESTVLVYEKQISRIQEGESHE